MKDIINWIKNKLWTNKDIFLVSGDIAERFHEKDSAEYDDLREKLTYWIRCGFLE